MRELRLPAGERVATTLMWAAAAFVAGSLLWILGDMIVRGLGGLSPAFLTSAPADAGRAGGIGPILVSTLAILAVCIGVAAPLGLATAVFLSELAVGRRGFGDLVRRSLDALAAVPSIVFGLFGNALFCHVLGLGFSILSGGLTLACMALPLLIRTTEEALRAVPQEQRLGAAALGLSRLTTLRRLLLPAAAPGIGAGLVLGVGRAIAETAALLFTSGYVTRMPGSLLDSGRSLSVHVFDLAMNVPGGNENAYASACVLVLALLAINALAVEGTRWWARRAAR
ncbi:MAG: phosphate ABC transporter permease PstA [Planctomycetota bacterium]